MTTRNAAASITASLTLTAGVIPRGIALINGFEGGVNGSVVGPFDSGNASGNPWDANHTGSGGGAVLAYDSTQAAHGVLSCLVVAPNTAQYLSWTASMLTAQATQPKVWFRLYLFFAAVPGFTHTVFEALAGASSAARVNLNADGTLSLAGSGGTSIPGMTTTSVIPLNSWFRVEGSVAGDPAAGQVSLALYDSFDSTFATEAKSATGANTAGPLTEWRFGCTRVPGTGNTATFWMDDCGLSNTGALGPVLYGFAPVRTDDGGAITGVTVSAAGAAGMVGSTTTTGLYPTDGNTRLGAATAADNATGRPMVLAAQKLYYGNVPPATITDGQGADLMPLANAGCFFWICIEPDIHGADTALMVSRLTTWIAAMPGGASQLGVDFYQEVQDKLSAADYLTCCQNNSAAVHNLGLPVCYDIAGHTNPSTWTSYYPGDQYVDVVGMDEYAGHWVTKYDPVTNPDPLSAAWQLALAHGKSFGIFEMGSAVQSNAPITGSVSEPGFILYIQSLQSIMTALPLASRSHCMWYSGDHNGPGSNVISGPNTTIAAGSAGGSIQNVATWSHPSPGVLAAVNISGAGFGTGISAGNLYIQCDDNTVARVYYTGISGNTFTGCTYIGTFPAGGAGNTTVSAGNFLAVYTFASGVTTDFRIPYVQAFFDALSGTRTVAAGGDVEGFFTSGDGGLHWQVANTGLYGGSWRRVACVQWSAYEADTLYGCAGLNGNGGGFLAGPGGGASWTLRSSTPQFSGNTTNIAGDQARSAGNLLAQAGTPAAPVMYTATYKQGVYRSKSTVPGQSWTNIGLATLPGGGTAFGRSIAVDPASSNTVYVAMYGAGIFKATNASTATPANFAHLAGSPAQAEEVIVLASGNIYAVAGSGGLYSSTNGGTTWTQLDPSGGHLSPSSYWMSLDGYTDAAGLDQLIVGCNSPVQAPSPAKGYRTLMWVTVDTHGAPTFSDLTASVPAIQIATIPPDTGRTWWHTATSVPFPSQATTYKEWLGGPGYFQPHPAIDRSTINSPNVVFYVAGSCGVFASTGNTVGASGPTATAQWALAINGMPVFIGHQIAADPNNPLHLSWATRDWGCFDITDGTGYNATSTIQTKPSASTTGGYSVGYDPVASTVYLSTGGKGANSTGQIWARLPGTYSYTNISAAGTTNPGGNVAYGLAGGRGPGGSPAPYLLALIQGSGGPSGTGGMYKCTGGTTLSPTSTWTRTDPVIGTAGGIPTGVQAPIIIDPASPSTAYCFDQGQGVFRSVNYGGTWTLIYAAVNTDSRSGYIALNPVVPSELWVSWQGAGTSGGLYRISNASTGSSPAATHITGIAAPGGICFAPNGDLYCLSLGGAAPLSPNTALMATTDRGNTWLNADNGSVAATASYPSNMVYAAGRVYIANDANIAAYGYPSLPVGAATATFAMTMSLAADGQDTSGPLKHGAANIAMRMSLAAGAGTTGQASAQIQMTMTLTTSGGIQALIVQQVAGAASFDYGSAGVEMTTTAGNTLVLLAGWDLSTGPTTAAMPAAYVHDSAGNYWYHVATTSGGVTGCRSSAWICPNAASIGWLSVSLTSFASSLAYTVIELAGMPSLYALDVVDTAASASAKTLALNPGTTTGSDFAFSVFATGAITAPLSVPAGWNALNSVVAAGGATGRFLPVGTPANPVMIFPYFLAPPAGTNLGITYTLNQAVPVSGVTFAVRSAVYPPPQADPDFPLIKVEAGFGSAPGDPSQPPPAWTDITNRVIGPPGQTYIDITTGRQYEQGSAEAGVMEIWLDNHTGDFTPGNAASEFWPDVVLETPIRVSAFWQGSWFAIGYGYVERWPQEWPDLPQYGISKMVATDVIAVLAAVTMPSALDGDILLDAPYVLLPASEQYVTFANGLNTAGGGLGAFSPADAQGQLAQNFSRFNQRTGTYVDGNAAGTNGAGPAIAATGQTTSLLGSSATGFGTDAITGPITTPSAGPGIIYTDPNLPSPLTGDGVTVTFWVIIPAAVATANLQPVVFTAYGPPSNYRTASASLTVQILNETGSSTLRVTLADGSTLAASFNASPSAQSITLVLTSQSLTVYVNGAQAATTSLTAAQVTTWSAVTLGCPNYAYQTGGLVTGSFTAFDLAIYAYPLAIQRVESQFVTGSFGQQNADAIVRVAQIAAWAGLGIPVAGRMTFNGIPDGVLQGPAYNLAGSTAADAVNQVAQNHNTMVAAQPDGTLVYIHKWALFNQSPVAVFGDSPDPAQGQVPFLPAETYDYDDTYLYNVNQVTQQYGANNLFTVQAADFGSQQSYFARSAAATTITTMNALDAADLVNWKTTKYAQPALRVAGLTVDAAANPQVAFGAVLRLQQGQVATVTRDPAGAAVISETTLIQKIQHQIGPGLWKTALQLSPYTPENSVLELDTPPFNALGNVTLA